MKLDYREQSEHLEFGRSVVAYHRYNDQACRRHTDKRYSNGLVNDSFIGRAEVFILFLPLFCIINENLFKLNMIGAALSTKAAD